MSGYVNYLREDRERTMLKMRNEGENNIIRTLFKNKMSAKEIAEKNRNSLKRNIKNSKNLKISQFM